MQAETPPSKAAAEPAEPLEFYTPLSRRSVCGMYGAGQTWGPPTPPPGPSVLQAVMRLS